jgi:hypothetical protein
MRLSRAVQRRLHALDERLIASRIRAGASHRRHHAGAKLSYYLLPRFSAIVHVIHVE